ncbi:MAG TPA: cell division topological specificity factor MinE [Ktedonobacteraceae bacterium]|nr:cell division topological specificity factor MinE [Ktedonobacteraceae bacterium]
MSVFEFMVGRKKPTPGEVAKERLKVVLMHDRLKLNPELLSLIRSEILTVVSRRLEIDEEQMQVNLSHEGEADLLLANMPIRREKVTFEWDPPAYTPSSNVLRGTIHVEGEES